MSDSPLVSAYSYLLDALKQSITQRVKNEQEYAAAYHAEDRPYPKILNDELAGINEEFEANRQQLVAEHRDKLIEVESRFSALTAQVEQDFHATKTAAEKEYRDAAKQSESQSEENKWMMSSLVDDDSDSSPKKKLDQLKHRVNQARLQIELEAEHLEELYSQAETLVRGRGFWRSPDRAERIPQAESSQEALQQFSTAEEAARQQFEKLKRQTFPKLVSGWSLLFLILLAFGAMYAGGYFLLDRSLIGLGDISDQAWLLGLGVVCLIISLVGGLLGWDVSRRQTQSAFQTFYEPISRARQNHQQWQGISERELATAEEEYETHYRKLVAHREHSLKKFDSQRTDSLARFQRKRDQAIADATRLREAQLPQLLEQKGIELAQVEREFERSRESLKQQLEHEKNKRIAQHTSQVEQRDQHLTERYQQLASQWTSDISVVGQICAEFEDRVTPTEEWDDLLAPTWNPPQTIPQEIPFGLFGISLGLIEHGLPPDERLTPEVTDWTLPAVVPFPDAPAVILNYDAGGRTAAQELLQLLMLRLLTRIPPGSVRFTVLDPVGLGEPFSSFMHLADHNELLITNRIWTEPGQIDKQLTDLTEHLETIFQMYLRNEFASIEEYNEHAGEIAEPYRVLVVSGFPHSFSERAAQRLANIAASGPRCGVYLLLTRDVSKTLPRDFELSGIEQEGLVIDWQGDYFQTATYGEPPFILAPDPPPAAQTFSAIVKKIGSLSTTVRKVEVPFHRIAPADPEVWTADSRKILDIPLGRAGATRLQHLKLGIGTSQHVLIAGRTGSGKSTLLHIIITNAALRYAPDELELYLIDFKKGVEFKTYATGQLPHARVIAIESDREFGVSTLQKLDEVLKERGDLFREAGVQDVEGWRNQKPDHPMPRILLMIDEFQEFFIEDDKLSQTATLLLDRLVRQGRAFGVHVLLGSQTLGGAYSLARTTLSQMAVRIALQCSESDAHLILSEENSAARLLTRPGEAIYNDANGMMEGNSPFQIAWLDEAEKEKSLHTIRGQMLSKQLPPKSCIVFEGNVPADPALNRDLLEVLQAPPVDTATPLTIWLGDPVTISDPSLITFRRQPGQNVLLVGQDEQAVRGIFSVAMLATKGTLQTKYNDDVVWLVDGESQSGQISEPWQDLAVVLNKQLHYSGPSNVEKTVAGLTVELEMRREQPDKKHRSLCVFISDLSQFREIRKSDDDFSFGSFDKEKSATPSKLFGDLLREGPAVGIHFFIWCTSYNNVDRWLGRGMLKEFEYRIAFQMSGTDSSNLIDSPAANRLGVNRAVLYRDDQGSWQKFRPYGPPEQEWLESLL